MALRRSKKAASKARMVRALDDDARQRVFARDGGICIRCNNGSRAVQWAHVLSRRHPCLRWDEDNAMTLCAGCHMFWHHEPALAVDWFIKNFGDRWKRIKAILQVNPKVRIKDLYDDLMSDPPSVAVRSEDLGREPWN